MTAKQNKVVNLLLTNMGASMELQARKHQGYLDDPGSWELTEKQLEFAKNLVFAYEYLSKRFEAMAKTERRRSANKGRG